MRAAFLAFAYFPEVHRGTERIMADLGAGLERHGDSVQVITSHPGRRRHGDIGGLDVIRNPRPPDGPAAWLYNQRHMSHVGLSYRDLRRGDFDLAHAFYPTDALASGRWGRRTGKPTVLTLMGMCERDPVTDKLGRTPVAVRAMRGATVTVALSDAAADSFPAHGLPRPRTIYPSVDLERFTPGGERADPPTLICAAALDDVRKRAELLLAGFRLARRDHAGLRLVLATSRPSAEPWASLAGEDGVEVIDGSRDPGALPRAYAQASASVLTSHDEAFGLVVAESLACGTPAVGPSDGAIPEVLGEGDTGRMFEGDEPAAVARAIHETLELAAEPATAGRCRERAEHFAPERTLAAYRSLYEELLQAV